MELEKQLVNFELSRKLDELGVKQESLFNWRENGDLYMGGLSILGGSKSAKMEQYSAYTVAEMGEGLPMLHMPVRDSEHNDEWLWLRGVKKQWADTEANARAQVRIYLIKHDLLDTSTL